MKSILVKKFQRLKIQGTRVDLLRKTLIHPLTFNCTYFYCKTQILNNSSVCFDCMTLLPYDCTSLNHLTRSDWLRDSKENIRGIFFPLLPPFTSVYVPKNDFVLNIYKYHQINQNKSQKKAA